MEYLIFLFPNEFLFKVKDAYSLLLLSKNEANLKFSGRGSVYLKEYPTVCPLLSF
jgi:hypothetical protein